MSPGSRTNNKQTVPGARIDLQHQFLFISLLARAADRFSYLSKGNRFRFMDDLSARVTSWWKLQRRAEEEREHCLHCRKMNKFDI